MTCKYICDGCGKEALALSNGRSYFKPHDWFQRGDDDGIQTACSRKCIEAISENSGKTAVIAPF